MGINRVSDNVYSVGVMNPSLRVFDIIMEARYGTSYNAYLINDKKTVLVETVHEDYFDEYIYNIGLLADIGAIDYLIVNHTELDHTGGIKKLLEICPKLTIVCSMPAKKYLTAILNCDFSCITVKHGDELNIGNTTLKFAVAPMLHWPDSMMTYHPNDKVLFSCDFLGCHFCEPQLTDDKIHYKKEYLEEFAYYYQGIFGPFKPFVLEGIEKIKDFALDVVAPSHGPILVEGIKDRIADYKKWSTPKNKDKKTAAVLYASAYGCTKQLAEHSAETLRTMGVETVLIDVETTTVAESAKAIAEADGIMVGSCTINRDAPSIVWSVLSSIDAINVKSKPAVTFGSFGWSGEAPNMMAQRLEQLKFKVITDPIKANFLPSEAEIKAVKEAAAAMAEMLK